MSRILMLSLLAVALAGVATTAVPTASAVYCAGTNPTLTETCNDALELGYAVVGYVVDHVEDCTPPGVRWTCEFV